MGRCVNSSPWCPPSEEIIHSYSIWLWSNISRNIFEQPTSAGTKPYQLTAWSYFMLFLWHIWEIYRQWQVLCQKGESILEKWISRGVLQSILDKRRAKDLKFKIKVDSGQRQASNWKSFGFTMVCRHRLFLIQVRTKKSLLQVWYAFHHQLSVWPSRFPSTSHYLLKSCSKNSVGEVVDGWRNTTEHLLQLEKVVGKSVHTHLLMPVKVDMTLYIHQTVQSGETHSSSLSAW